MRWQAPARDPDIRSGFLYFPKTIKGETRWWEWATWQTEIRMTMASGKAYRAAIRWIDAESKDRDEG